MAKTKIRKLSPDTTHVVDFMIQSMLRMPKSTWHPSTFTMTMPMYRGNIAPAVRYLKEMGLIEIDGYNIDNQPLYKPSKALLEAAKVKKNPVDYRKPKPKKGPGGWTSFWHEGHRVYIRKHKGKDLAVMRGEGTMWYFFVNDRELGHHKTLKKAKAAAMAAVRN